MSGITNDVCVVYPAISAVEAGYEVQVVVDAGGSPTKVADDTALRRMERHGVTLTSTNQLLAELVMDWSSPIGSAIQKSMPLRERGGAKLAPGGLPRDAGVATVRRPTAPRRLTVT